MVAFLLLTVALPLKGNEFQANHNARSEAAVKEELLLYLSKVTNFKQITTQHCRRWQSLLLLLYLSKVTNFKQITTKGNKLNIYKHCCFTSQR